MSSRVVQLAVAPTADDQARKFGIWFNDRMQVAGWRLGPNQRIVAHCHPKADSTIVVLQGSGDYIVHGDEGPPSVVQYESRPDSVVVPPPVGDAGEPERHSMSRGSVAVTPAGRFYGLVNTGDEVLVAVVITAPDSSNSIYTVRSP